MIIQDKIILGLLLDGDKSSYDLIQNGHVHITEERRGGARNRKVHSITEEGEKEFLRWAGEPIALDKPMDPALVKMFFFNYVEDPRKLELVEAYLREIETVGATGSTYTR